MPKSVSPAARKYPPKSLTALTGWKALKDHARKMSGLHLRDLFAADPKRGKQMTVETLGLFFDYSKNRITDETVELLVELARESGLSSRIDAMFRGDKINVTEGRAVLHVALRAPKGAEHCCRRQECGAGGPCGAGQDGRVLRPRAQRRVEGPHRQAHSQRDQHRHRRIGPGAGDGVRGAQGITATAT